MKTNCNVFKPDTTDFLESFQRKTVVQTMDVLKCALF